MQQRLWTEFILESPWKRFFLWVLENPGIWSLQVLENSFYCLYEPCVWFLSGTTRVSQYQKKHSPTHTYHDHQSSLICFLHLIRSMASPLFNLCAWQSFFIISLQFFFGLPLQFLAWHPPLHTTYISSPVIVFFLQHTCPYHRNLFYCNSEIMSSNPSLTLNPSLGTSEGTDKNGKMDVWCEVTR